MRGHDTEKRKNRLEGNLPSRICGNLVLMELNLWSTVCFLKGRLPLAKSHKMWNRGRRDRPERDPPRIMRRCEREGEEMFLRWSTWLQSRRR